MVTMWGRLISQNIDSHQTISLDRQEVTLGRSDTCTVPIPISHLSKVHCRFWREATAAYVEDLSSNGIWINGTLLGKGKQHLLKKGDMILVLKKTNTTPLIEFLFSPVDPELTKTGGASHAAAPAPTQLTQAVQYSSSDDEGSDLYGRLISLNPEHANVELAGDTPVTIGRDGTCTVCVNVTGLSRTHAKFFRDDRLVFVEDLSSNGLFVNGTLVGHSKRRLINTGDEITLLKRKGNHYVAYVYNACTSVAVGNEGGLLLRYDLGNVLGTGNFATVKLGVNKETGERFAVKCINKQKFRLQQPREGALMDEVNILKQMHHENIIGIADMFETDETLYLVLELVTGGELFDRIIDKGKFTEGEARLIMQQLLDGVEYIHGQGIAHRDLKPENVLIKSKNSNVVKISDFGLSRVISEGSFMGTLCGTPQYIAPEILQKSSHHGYDKAVDMWSLGVIFYVLLSGYLPFKEDSDTSIYEQIKCAQYSFPDPQWSGITEEAKDFCRGMMTLDPSKRLTATQALQHRWMSMGSPSDTLVLSVPHEDLGDLSNCSSVSSTTTAHNTSANSSTSLSGSTTHSHSHSARHDHGPTTVPSFESAAKDTAAVETPKGKGAKRKSAERANASDDDGEEESHHGGNDNGQAGANQSSRRAGPSSAKKAKTALEPVTPSAKDDHTISEVHVHTPNDHLVDEAAQTERRSRPKATYEVMIKTAISLLGSAKGSSTEEIGAMIRENFELPAKFEESLVKQLQRSVARGLVVTAPGGFKLKK